MRAASGPLRARRAARSSPARRRVRGAPSRRRRPPERALGQTPAHLVELRLGRLRPGVRTAALGPRAPATLLERTGALLGAPARGPRASRLAAPPASRVPPGVGRPVAFCCLSQTVLRDLELVEGLAVLVLEHAQAAPRRRGPGPRPCAGRRPLPSCPARGRRSRAAATDAASPPARVRARSSARGITGCARRARRNRLHTSRPITKTSTKPLNNAIVRHGTPAASTGHRTWSARPTAGSPTPDSNRSGSITETVPSATRVCGRASQRLPDTVAFAVELVADAAFLGRVQDLGARATTGSRVSKSLGSITTRADLVAQHVRPNVGGDRVEIVGAEHEAERAVGDGLGLGHRFSSAALRARAPITREPRTPVEQQHREPDRCDLDDARFRSLVSTTERSWQGRAGLRGWVIGRDRAPRVQSRLGGVCRRRRTPSGSPTRLGRNARRHAPASAAGARRRPRPPCRR